MRRLLPLVLALLGAGACSDTRVIVPTAPTGPTAPSSPTLPRVTADRIEFRVLGNATSARVRHSNSEDGLTQVISTLPFLAELTTTAPSIFLSLEATPISFSFANDAPFLSAQIVVNGQLFREASSSTFILNTLTVSGTWRH